MEMVGWRRRGKENNNKWLKLRTAPFPETYQAVSQIIFLTPSIVRLRMLTEAEVRMCYNSGICIDMAGL